MSEQVLTQADFLPATKVEKNSRKLRPSLSYWEDAWIRLRKSPQTIVSLWVTLALVAFTLFGPLLWKADPTVQDLNHISERPSSPKSWIKRESVLVLPSLDEFKEIIDPSIPEKPDADGSQLLAPQSIRLLTQPTIQAVRLNWTAVKGASGYVIYRTDFLPHTSDQLGVPLTEINGGNHISYEDRFNLESRTYYYSVVAKNGDESNAFHTLKVEIPNSVTLEEALKIDPDAKAGERITPNVHPFGTDYLGRDLLARLMAGARVSLFIGFFAPLFATMLGIAVGGISGYYGGKVDQWLMRFTDLVLALPFLLLMILFKIAFGAKAGESGIIPMLISMAVLDWTNPARLIRGQILQLRESEFVQAARLLGAKPGYLIFRHLVPNTLGIILVSLTFAIPSAIFTEAFLSFIGMGVVPPTPSWGSMCNDGMQTFLTHPHEFFFPSLFISITVLAFNLLGDGLRDALDPKMRSLT